MNEVSRASRRASDFDSEAKVPEQVSQPLAKHRLLNHELLAMTSADSCVAVSVKGGGVGGAEATRGYVVDVAVGGAGFAAKCWGGYGWRRGTSNGNRKGHSSSQKKIPAKFPAYQQWPRRKIFDFRQIYRMLLYSCTLKKIIEVDH
jgi:hypothetical protein